MSESLPLSVRPATLPSVSMVCGVDAQAVEDEDGDAGASACRNVVSKKRGDVA